MEHTPSVKRRSDYLPALTGLRFVLAFWVIAHHLTGPGMMLQPAIAGMPRAFASLMSGGYLAVQTFFVLSGFVLARSYARTVWDRGSVFRYLSARFARIYPTYAFSLIIVSYFIGRYLARPWIAPADKISTLFDYALLLQGWRPSGGPGWNTPAWSLSCEFFFYLLLPAVLPFIWRAGRNSLAAIVAISIAAPLALAHLGVPFYWKPIHHFADFTTGIASARAYAWLESRDSRRGFAAWLYLPAIAAGAALIAWPHALDGTYLDLNTALRPLNAIALIGFALGGGAIAKILSTRPVEYLGQASYSMYILHVPLLWWYGNGGVKHFHLPWPIAAGIYAALVVSLAVASYELVEKPANRRIRRWTERRLAPTEQLRAAA